jgi:hypothetical protein
LPRKTHTCLTHNLPLFNNGNNFQSFLQKFDWDDFKKWLYFDRHPAYAKKMFNHANSYFHLIFTDEFVFMEHNRKKLEIIKSLALLTRYVDIKYDAFFHEQFTTWLKRKEIKWTVRNASYNYEHAKNLPIETVVEIVNKLPLKYSIFAKFALSTGLRSEESMRAFNEHSKLCRDGVMELFWDRKTKKANSVYCHPSLHEKITFTVSRGVYNYINKKDLGFELRFLRKLNYTINATKIDPLLAEFMQGRRGNVSQRHYFLPLMSNNKKKWQRIWGIIIK